MKLLLLLLVLLFLLLSLSSSSFLTAPDLAEVRSLLLLLLLR